MAFFKRLFSTSGRTHSFTAPLTPAAPVFVIGDLHGCARQMRDLQAQMHSTDPDAHQVYVGDYVDRGEQSQEVLQTLYDLRENPAVTCLCGNHEDMMLRFLQEPSPKSARWLQFGGLNTLGSFGITEGAPLLALAEKLQAAIGPDMINWLETLPTSWDSGNLTVVHAGADPALPMDQQQHQTLKWGHPDFLTTPRSDGIWVAHGHTIVEQASAAQGRVAVDTGVYATGRLTAAYITPDTCAFLQADEPRVYQGHVLDL